MTVKDKAIQEALDNLHKCASSTSKKKTYKPSWQQQKAVLDFAIANKCLVNPLGMGYYLEGYNEFKHCPCDKNRPTCPCPEAPAEIKEKGHCKCQLFWGSYEDYEKAKGLDGDGNGK